MGTSAFIGIGSNLGDRVKNCLDAIESIGDIPGCSVEARSDLFTTEPQGIRDQDWYVNGAVSIYTCIEASQLLKRLMAIEISMGRVREKKWGPRNIDLDILFFGGEIIETEGLIVPHPLVQERRFVLVPMVQLAPDLRHPLLRKSMAELLDGLKEDGQAVLPLKEET